MPADKVNDKGSQPRNRELKGQQISWPKEVVNNFKWVLPKMPKGYPMRNPRIIRFLYEKFTGNLDNKNPKSCAERAKSDTRVEFPNSILTPTPGLGIPYSFAADAAAAQARMNCDGTAILNSDGFTTISAVGTPYWVDPNLLCAPILLDIEEIGAKLQENNPEKFFEIRAVEGDIFDEIFPSTDVTDKLGLYGPKVLTFIISQRPYAYPNPNVNDLGEDGHPETFGGGYAWPPLKFTAGIKRFAEQTRQLEVDNVLLQDRWVKYDTYLVFDTDTFIRKPIGALGSMINDTLQSFGYHTATRTKVGDIGVISGDLREPLVGLDNHNLSYPLPYPTSVEGNPDCPDVIQGAVTGYQAIIDEWYASP